MKIAGKSKADLGFRRNRAFVAGTRNSEPVIQRRKSVFPFAGRQRSARSRPSLPAIGRFNCMILGPGHPPFMWADNRPSGDIRGPELAAPKRPVGSVPPAPATSPCSTARIVAPAILKMIGAGAILERPVIEMILTHLGPDPQQSPKGEAREADHRLCQPAAGVMLPARNPPATVENPYRGCLHLQAGRFKTLICNKYSTWHEYCFF
jgi:hypothetical protein